MVEHTTNLDLGIGHVRKKIYDINNIYLTTHTTHFINGYIGVGYIEMREREREREREEMILFNDTLNTFYLWLYGVRHMVNDNSDSER